MKQHPPSFDGVNAFKNQACWRSLTVSNNKQTIIKTGYTELDQVLKLGGWPMGVVTEIGLDNLGIGELRLLMPALRAVLSSASPHAIWVAPPYRPYAPALVKECLNLDNLFLVSPSSMPNILWAAEQALQVGSCGAVFCWTGQYNLNQKESRRLQLMAEKSNIWLVLFRHRDCLQQASAARLRLQLNGNHQGTLNVNVHKQPEAYGGQQCTVSLAPHYEQWQRIPVALLPEHNQSLASPKFLNKHAAKEHHQAVAQVLCID